MKFCVDFSRLLGSGEFGRVYQGILKVADKNQRVAVKVPILQPENMQNNLSCKSLSALFSEIKVLASVGTHEHIVQLMGLYTEKLSSGKIHVFLELSVLGSLQTYLRNLNVNTIQITRQTPVAIVAGSVSYVEMDYVETDNKGAVNDRVLRDLAKWSWEISNGMAYLTTKRVCILQ